MPTMTTEAFDVLSKAAASAKATAAKMNEKRPNDALVNTLLGQLRQVERQVATIVPDAPTPTTTT